MYKFTPVLVKEKQILPYYCNAILNFKKSKNNKSIQLVYEKHFFNCPRILHINICGMR